jgi:hypothetical protein
MRTIFKTVLFGLFAFTFAVQCNTHHSSDKSIEDTTKSPVSSTRAATKFDIINEQFNSESELMTEDIIALKIIDTTLTTQLGDACYSDTIVRLNDSVYYSVLRVNDKAGLCTYFFVASFNKKNKNVIASKFLHPDCDVDYSQDTYELYDHSIAAEDKIQLTKTTVFQKKNRRSPIEEENIEHEQKDKSFISISQTGQINVLK